MVGAGYIGLELGIAFRKLGSEVTIVEALDRILPLYDAELVAPVAKWLKKHDVTVHLGARAKGLPRQWGEALAVETADGKTLKLEADNILVTVGRKPATSGWGLENMAVDMDGKFVRVDDRCATAMKNVWAIGDLVGEPMLEHKAATQGEMVAEIIAGKDRRFEPAAIPAVCFTEPEIVSVGMLPDEAAAHGEILTGVFPFLANGRALSMDAGEGFVRVDRPQGRSPHPRHPGRGRACLRIVERVLPRAGNGRGARRHRRHHPCPSDAGRSLPRSGAAHPRPRHSYLNEVAPSP